MVGRMGGLNPVVSSEDSGLRTDSRKSRSRERNEWVELWIDFVFRDQPHSRLL